MIQNTGLPLRASIICSEAPSQGPGTALSPTLASDVYLHRVLTAILQMDFFLLNVFPEDSPELPVIIRVLWPRWIHWMGRMF